MDFLKRKQHGALRGGRRLCLVRGFIVVWAFGVAAAAASLTAMFERDTIYEGETAEIIVRVQSARSEGSLIPPEVPGITLQRTGQSSSYSFVNGVRSASWEYRYAVEVPGVGEYVLPPFQAELDGAMVSSLPLRLRVLPGQNPAISQVAMLLLRVEKQTIYVGEVLPLEIGVAFRGGGYNEAPQLQQEGLILGSMEQLPRRLERIGGVDYGVDPFRSYVIAARSGKLKLGPATLPFGVPVRSRLGLFGRESMVVKLRSPVIDLEVKPLPDEGVPVGFTGAVGRFGMQVMVSTNAVTAGDPILVTVEITGEGPIESLQMQPFDSWDGFKVYAPETSVELTDKLGLRGSKRFTQVVIPERADIGALPAIQFSYFDPALDRYQTLRHEPVPIEVRRGAVVTRYALPGTGTPGEEANAGTTQEIVHIKNRLGQYGAVQVPLVVRPWFMSLYTVPLLIWLGVSLEQWRRARVARNPRLRRQLQVDRIVREGMAQLREAAARNDTEAFFAIGFRLLQERLGQRLDMPAPAIDELSLDVRLEREVGSEVVAEVRRLFHAYGLARYAPGRLHAELPNYAQRIEAVLDQLRNR